MRSPLHQRQQALNPRLRTLLQQHSGTSRLPVRTNPLPSPLRLSLAIPPRPRLLTRRYPSPAPRAGPTIPPNLYPSLLPTTASLRSSTTAAVVAVADNTRVRDEADTGAGAVAVLAVEASSVDVDVVAVVSSGAVAASVVLLVVRRLRKACTEPSLLFHFGFYAACKASISWYGLPAYGRMSI